MNYYHGSSLWSFSKGGVSGGRRLGGLLVLNSSCLSIPKVRSCRRLRTAAIAARLRTAAIAANSESSPAEPHSYGETFDIISFDRKWKHFQK